MLWRDLKAWQVYGANTDVGKTIVSTVLCRALQRRASPNGLLYLKPVSTGPQAEADDR
jgi:dethiobiotin synthetase/adenosylmethionine--8-amino-7-oxononanoate aminotransferase